MDLPEPIKDLLDLWDSHPGPVVLALIGLGVFLYLVVDAWRHKHPRRRSHKPAPGDIQRPERQRGLR